ncbi:MAG: ABC transporter ATP-binding protein [Candidatus Methanoperedens sp.]|nr:ABC transporter ATP-binding protein [Candidatus Methanoperedens sp.]
MHGENLIRLKKVTKTHEGAGGAFHALREVDLQVMPGEFVAVIGKSGSGKSTLLNMLGGIDSPTSGEIWIGDTQVHTLDQDQLAKWRGHNVGFVFQFFQLLPTLTILENVMLPMDFSNAIPARERMGRAFGLLELVGIREQADKMPSLLSGGQQQRAAIARALANDPALLLADEPTGNLDSRTAEAILLLFKGLSASGKTIVMVTHERDITPWVSSVIKLADGRVVNGSDTL